MSCSARSHTIAGPQSPLQTPRGILDNLQYPPGVRRWSTVRPSARVIVILAAVRQSAGQPPFLGRPTPGRPVGDERLDVPHPQFSVDTANPYLRAASPGVM